MYISPVILAEKVLQGTEKLTGTEIVSMTLIGLAVVFCALLVLVVFLYCSGSIFKKNGGKQPATKKAVPPAPAKKKSAAAKGAAKKTAPQASAPAKPAAPSAAAGEDEEVIAVIMAAIAAMGAAEGKQYALRSVRQVTRGGSGRSVWAQAGIMDATKPF